MNSTRVRTSLLGLALTASMGLGVIVGFSASDDDLFELRKSLRIFGAVYEEVVTGYVEPVDPSHLM
ncbi:MAG: S41 family peptidase, partial [Bacteroidetes bacterium QS_4_64_154]